MLTFILVCTLHAHTLTHMLIFIVPPHGHTCAHAHTVCSPCSPVILHHVICGVLKPIVEQAPLAIEALMDELDTQEANGDEELGQPAGESVSWHVTPPISVPRR